MWSLIQLSPCPPDPTVPVSAWSRLIPREDGVEEATIPAIDQAALGSITVAGKIDLVLIGGETVSMLCVVHGDTSQSWHKYHKVGEEEEEEEDKQRMGKEGGNDMTRYSSL